MSIIGLSYAYIRVNNIRTLEDEQKTYWKKNFFFPFSQKSIIVYENMKKC